MREESGATYTSGNLAKLLIAGEAKMGKTTWLVASALGLFPGQELGGLVDDPANLHVVTFDESALRGISDFLVKDCKAPQSALGFKVYNMEEDFKKALTTKDDYDRTFYNAVVRCAEVIKGRCKGGTAVVIISSLTSVAEGVLRSTLGPAGESKGSGGNKSKWPDFAMQMTELRNNVNGIPAHVLWEGHVYKVPLREGQTEMEETLQIPGRTGVNWPANVSYVARLRRNFGVKVTGTRIDKTFMDTRASFSFAAGGRGFLNLEAQEADLTKAFQKLGLQTGGWRPEVAAPPTKPS